MILESRVVRRRRQVGDEILAAAWALSRETGLTGWTLAELGRRVGMQAASLYSYFESKNAIYDAMFRQGHLQYLEMERTRDTSDLSPIEAIRQGAASFVEFALADPTRYQHLFQRTIPGFEPSPEAYALAVEGYQLMVEAFAAAGITDQRHIDLFTAITSGILSQQIANDPGGDRFSRLIGEAVDLHLAHVTSHVTERTYRS